MRERGRATLEKHRERDRETEGWRTVRGGGGRGGEGGKGERQETLKRSQREEMTERDAL